MNNFSASALRLLAAAGLLAFGAACMHSEKAPMGVNAKPGSAAVAHGKTPVTTTANSSAQH